MKTTKRKQSPTWREPKTPTETLGFLIAAAVNMCTSHAKSDYRKAGAVMRARLEKPLKGTRYASYLRALNAYKSPRQTEP